MMVHSSACQVPWSLILFIFVNLVLSGQEIQCMLEWAIILRLPTGVCPRFIHTYHKEHVIFCPYLFLPCTSPKCLNSWHSIHHGYNEWIFSLSINLLVLFLINLLIVRSIKYQKMEENVHHHHADFSYSVLYQQHWS